MTKKTLIGRAIKAREEARTVRDFPRANRINFLLYLIGHAHDVSEGSLKKLEEAIR